MLPSSDAFSAEELYHQALDRLEAGDPAGAVVRLRHCLQVDPGMLDAMHGLMRALREVGDVDSAIAVARQLLQLNPEEVLAHTSLSILYQHKGMIAEAEAEALKAKLLGWKLQLQQIKAQP